MFRPKAAGSFASKIAHTSTIPVLGNKDLKLLQDLITNEKTVLTSLQRLAADLTRASESLKTWGLGEGEDLGDVLSHATNIYSHISSALSNFANHEHTVRTHLKAIRSREERLDETKRKRKTVAVKADAADKKLSKMSGENKNLPAQTELLNKLRDEIRQLDTDIMVEEARLSDFKRLSTRNFMALKLGGLLEFGEKATIVGELGKLLIDEIPLDSTPPGQPRSFYQSYAKTESLDAEVSRCIGEVVFTPPPDVSESVVPASVHRASDEAAVAESSPGYPTPADVADATILNDTGSSLLPEGPRAGELGEPEQGYRRFGSGPIRGGEDGQRMLGGGGQFSTFPVKARSGGPSGDQSLSASITSTLDGEELSTAIATSGSPTQIPSANLGNTQWNGDDHLQYAVQDKDHRGDVQEMEKGVRFRTPSMEMSGLGPVAPGVASPMYPSAGWRGRMPVTSYDAPVVLPVPEDDEKESTRIDDDYAFNVAVARDIARELDSPDFPTPPSNPYAPPSPTVPEALQPTRPLSVNRAPSPLSPPTAPFAHPRDASPPHSMGSPHSLSPMTQHAPRSVSSLSPPADGMSSEYLAPTSSSPTNVAVTSSASGGAPRTISAAAFKRAVRSVSEAEPGKRRPLPSSPRPDPWRNVTGGSVDHVGVTQREQPSPGAQPPEYVPQQEPESPVASDYGSLGNVRIANSEAGLPGYSQ